MVIALILILTVILIMIGCAYFSYRIAFYSPDTNRESLPATNGTQYDPYREVMRLIYYQLADRPYEDVTIISKDGLILHGRYYHIKDSAPVAIAFHGYRSSPMTDFSGGSELCFDLGQNLLLVDQRSHGKSEGSTICFGIAERHDCMRWIEYAVDRFGKDVKILLYGISMGASTVLMASDLPLPKNVKGIIADCPYANAGEIIRKVCADMRIPARLGYPFVRLGAWLFGKFDLQETDAIKSVQKATVPILIIHGEADSFVPCEMSEEISRANPDKVLRYTFPGAEHGISYLVDRKRYRLVVTDFLNSVLN